MAGAVSLRPPASAEPFSRRCSLSTRALLALALLALLAFAVSLTVQPALRSNPQLAAASAETSPPTPAPVSKAAKQQALDNYAKLPLGFTPNAGQTDERVRYLAQGAGYGFYFADDKVTLSLTKPADGSSGSELIAAPESLKNPLGEGHHERGVALELRFIGASPQAQLEAGEKAAGSVNYLGAGAAERELPSHAELTYRNLWPGIDMTFRGEGGKLKYEFHVAPGADPSQIRLAYAGADGLAPGGGGTLAIDTAIGKLSDARPLSYQRSAGKRVPVESNYALSRGGAGYGFALPAGYDRSRPLLIDPGLDYSTFLGGSSSDEGAGIAVDSAGSAYVTGTTTSADYPTTPGAYDQTHNGGIDVFVSKLNPSGSALDYSTFLGGTSSDQSRGIAVDGAGSAYVTGGTTSANYPTTPGAFDTSLNAVDGFVTKLTPAGSALAYSTFLGGTSSDEGWGIAVDGADSAYVTGFTESANFPTTPGAYDTSFNGGTNAFVTKLNPAGSGLGYSTFLGDSDSPFGIAVDGAGSAYVTGHVASAGFPTTPGAFDTSYNGGSTDAYVTKLNPSGSALDYSTFLGGRDRDQGVGIAVDGAGSAYVTGVVTSADYPTTPGAFDTSFNGSFDGFVTKLNPAGSALDYSTFLGGASFDDGRGIAIDGAGNAYVTGETTSANFPTTPGAFDTSFNSSTDAFVTKLNASGAALDYSTFLGGTGGSDVGFGIAVDGAGKAYVTGFTTSADYPTTPGAFDTSFNGGFTDAFVTKLDPQAGSSEPANLTLSPATATNTVGTEHCVTATVTDDSGNPVPDVTVVFEVSGANDRDGSETTDADGEARFCYTGTFPGAETIEAFADTDDDGTQDSGEPSDTATKTWVLPQSGEGCKVTGGGSITAANGDKATFGGNAQVKKGVKGEVTYQDHGPATPFSLKSIEILALTCDKPSGRATIFGTAKVNGQGSFDFRIDVTDNGEPGRNDTYRIRVSNGYDSGEQRLEGGNVQVHK